MNANNVIAFPSGGRKQFGEEACFDAMLSEAIEGLRYRKATKQQREAKRRQLQESLNASVKAVLEGREELLIVAGGRLTVSFREAGCHLLVEVTDEGQVDLSWLYDGRVDPKFSGTVGLEEARDIVLHLVAVRLASLQVEAESSAG